MGPSILHCGASRPPDSLGGREYSPLGVGEGTDVLRQERSKGGREGCVAIAARDIRAGPYGPQPLPKCVPVRSRLPDRNPRDFRKSGSPAGSLPCPGASIL